MVGTLSRWPPAIPTAHAELCDQLAPLPLHLPRVRRPTPIRRIHIIPYIPMKRRIRPRRHAPGVPMFYGIEMNVIDMPLEIQLIANHVLMKTALPDGRIAVLRAGCRGWTRRPQY